MDANVSKSEARTSADAIKLMTKICKMVDKMKPNELVRSVSVDYDVSTDEVAYGLPATSNLMNARNVSFTVFVYDASKERGFHNTHITIYSWEGAEKVEKKLEAIRNILVATSVEQIYRLSDEANQSRR